MTSLGMNTGTGARNTPAPGIGRETMLEKLRNVRDVRNINHQLKQFNDNYDIDKMRQRLSEDEARFDAYGERSARVRHGLQKDLNEQNQGFNRENSYLQMQDNNAQRSYTSIDKWNELQSLEKQNTEDNRAGNNNAAMEYQATVESARLQAQASQNNAALNAYSNLYSNFVAPRGDFKYW